MKQKRGIALLIAVLILLSAFAVPSLATDTVVVTEDRQTTETTEGAAETTETEGETTAENSEENPVSTEDSVTAEPDSQPETGEDVNTAHTTPFPDSEEESVTDTPASVPETDPNPEDSDHHDSMVADATVSTTESDEISADDTNHDVVTTDENVETTDGEIDTEAPSLELIVTDDVPEDGQPMLGETITYTLTIVRNEKGFCYGTFFFRPSDNLVYESSTLLGEDFQDAEYVKSPEHMAYGAVGMTVGKLENYTQTGDYITITFRVVNVGEATVEFFPYDVISAPDRAPVDWKVNHETITHIVQVPEKPVIATETLPDGVKDMSYSTVLRADVEENITWELVDGELPEGLTLMKDGTLSGTPTEFGSFTFSVKAILLDVVGSEPKTLTLIVLETPRTLELNENTKYAIGETNYLTGVVAKTGLSTLQMAFRNADNVKVYNIKGEEITDAEAFIGTGCTVSLVIGEEKVHTVTVVVLGDTDGDGEITVFDYVNIRKHFMKKATLTNANLTAADVDADGEITVFDYVNVRKHFMKKLDIYQ